MNFKSNSRRLKTANYEIQIQHLILIKNSDFSRRLWHCWHELYRTCITPLGEVAHTISE